MGGHPFPEIPCTVCSKPVDLQADLCADENGKAVHEECYLRKITSQDVNSRATLISSETKTLFEARS